jgi:hypothetical protein
MYGHGIRPPGTRGPVLALPLLELISSVADRAVPMRLRIRPRIAQFGRPGPAV